MELKKCQSCGEPTSDWYKTKIRNLEKAKDKTGVYCKECYEQQQRKQGMESWDTPKILKRREY